MGLSDTPNRLDSNSHPVRVFEGAPCSGAVGGSGGAELEADRCRLCWAAVYLGEFGFCSGQADAQSVDFPEPAFTFGLAMRSWRLSRMSPSRARWFGSGQSIEQRTQALSSEVSMTQWRTPKRNTS